MLGRADRQGWLRACRPGPVELTLSTTTSLAGELMLDVHPVQSVSSRGMNVISECRFVSMIHFFSREQRE